MSESGAETVSFQPGQHFRLTVLRRFEQLKSDLEPLLPDADIQRVGSTAIPGSLTRGDRVPAVGIHLTVIDGSCDIQWRFRDLLAASESLRSEYDDLKRQLEGKSMAKYREAKEKFVTRVLDGR